MCNVAAAPHNRAVLRTRCRKLAARGSQNSLHAARPQCLKRPDDVQSAASHGSREEYGEPAGGIEEGGPSLPAFLALSRVFQKTQTRHMRALHQGQKLQKRLISQKDFVFS